jgi:hypothetical protein
MLLHILVNLEDTDGKSTTADQKLMNLTKNEIFQINLMTLHNLKENTWRDLSDRTHHAQEMEIMHDLKVKASKKNTNGKTIHHWMMHLMTQSSMKNKFAEHIDMRGTTCISTTWSLREITLGWRSTLWPSDSIQMEEFPQL